MQEKLQDRLHRRPVIKLVTDDMDGAGKKEESVQSNSESQIQLPATDYSTWLSNACVLRRVRFFATPRTVAHQAPLSMGFHRQEYWRGLSFPSPGDLSDPGIEPVSPALADGFFTTGPPGKPCVSNRYLTGP